ncbi:MAG TPA: hypothetical protein VME43_26700 [Bryobacteraceae bacterium]|nr:hypothetical protein [Bryobacteraceae bacterium]
MSGPTSKESRLGFGLDALEVATFFCGLLVVIGLLTESGPEAWTAIIKHIWPHREVTGNALVTIGVFGEVAIGLFIARAAKREHLHAEAQIAAITERAAKAEERAANAEKDAAEANLARAKLEQRLGARNIRHEDHKWLVTLLSPHAGKLVDIIVFDHHMRETTNFGRQMYCVFLDAKWKCRLYEASASTYQIPGQSTLILTALGHIDDDFSTLAKAIPQFLGASGIDCGWHLDRFDAKGELGPPEFRLTCEDPQQYMGLRPVAPLRVQIGAKQIIAE